MKDLNIEEYEKVKKPESYFVKYHNVAGKVAKYLLRRTRSCIGFYHLKNEAEEYAKKIKYARKFLGR